MSNQALLELAPEELDEAFRLLMDQIAEEVESGQLDPEEANELIDEAYADYSEVLELEELEEEDDEDEDDEDDEDDYITIGELILELIVDQYGDDEESIAEALVDIASMSEGATPDDIVDLIEGNVEADNGLLLNIANLFELDEESAAGFLVIGAQERGEDVEDFEELVEAYPDDFGLAGIEDDIDDVTAEEISEEIDESLKYSRILAEKDRQLQQMQAEFTEAKIVNNLSTRLDNLERFGSKGVQAGWLPPFAYREIFAQFESNDDRIAAFSAVCQESQVDPETELYAIEKQLDLFERCGPLIRFGQEAYDEPLTPDELEDEALADELDDQALRNVRARRSRNSTIAR